MEQKLACRNGHVLQRVLLTSSGTCQICRETAELALVCTPCSYGLCQSCVSKSPLSSLARCPRGHSTTESCHNVDWNCDRCRETHKGGTKKSARCDLCDYDICADCLWKTSKSTNATTAAQHRDPSALLTASNAGTGTAGSAPPETCSKGHSMELQLHGVNWRCDVCAIVYAASSKRSYRCETCDYDRCESCWSKRPVQQETRRASVGSAHDSAGVQGSPLQQASNTTPAPSPAPGAPPAHPAPAQTAQQPSGQASPTTPGKEPVIYCPSRHSLYVEWHKVAWNCDGCRQSFQPCSRRSLRCSICDFDFCDQCWMFGPAGVNGVAVPGATIPHPTAASQPLQPQAPPPPPPTPSAPVQPQHVCQKGHPMTQIRHNQTWCCDVCRQQHGPNSILSLRCESCDFDVCENCFRKNTPAPPPTTHPEAGQAYVPKCRQGHVLKQTTHRRSWRCDGCLRTLSTGWEASMHCPPCQFDLCSRCVRPPVTQPSAPPPPPAFPPPAKQPVQAPPPPPASSGAFKQPPAYHSAFPPSSFTGTTAKPPPPSFSTQPQWGAPAAVRPSVFGTAGGTSTTQAPQTSAPAPFPSLTTNPENTVPAVTPTGRTRALFIGINYPGTSVELKGCVSDVQVMMNLLELLGYNHNDRRVLVDDYSFPHRTGHPDKQTIIQGLHWLVKGAQPGDSLFLHYSGHGSQLKDQDQDEDDGYDETMVPADYVHHGQIRDDDIHDIVCKSLPPGARLTSIMDCCHSGTLMDLEYMWVSEQSVLRRRRNGRKTMLSRGFEISSRKHIEADIVLFSGCKDAQTSADVKNVETFNHDLNDPGTAGGACTNALAEIVTTELNNNNNGFSMTYVQLLDAMQQSLHRRRFTQVPQMSTSRPIDLENKFSLFGPL